MENNNGQNSQNLAAIIRIESFGAKYDSKSSLSLDDQLYISEELSETKTSDFFTKNNVSINGNDTYKRRVNLFSTDSEQGAIMELETFTYKTSPIKISESLLLLFASLPSKDGHWLYVAQHWNPRAINRTIKQMVRLHNSGRTTIDNPARYFTFLVKLRKGRRS